MNKKIIITGATSGIGLELTKRFCADNIVYAGYRDDKKAETIPFYIDVAKNESIIEAANFIKSKEEKIDILINAAGCVVAGAMENLDVDKIRYQFEVNTFGHLSFTQKLIEKLDGAKIINISSMSSYGIFPFIAPYCASKRALDILFNSLKIEYGKNIQIISVKPGVIKTPLWEKSIEQNKVLGCESKKYQAEYDFLVKNAQKNSTKGLDVSKVADLAMKIANKKNPKSSYTVGSDAKFAEIFSKLPQDWVNFIVEKSLKMRLSK